LLEVLRRRWALLPSLLAVAVVCVPLVAAHLTFLHPPWPTNYRDEGYITAFADRMIRGHWLPYVDAVSHRGPMVYWIAALAGRVGGSSSFAPIRWLALSCSLATVVLTYLAAARERRPLAGAIASAVLVVEFVVDFRPDDGLAYNAEPLLDVFALAGLLCLVVASSPARARS
jgi:4-amino-4-deoxy-L-arabinose transferase-like glycosyltransferase